MFAVDPDGDNQVKADAAVVPPTPTPAGHASITVTLQSPAGAADPHPCKGSPTQHRAGSTGLRLGGQMETDCRTVCVIPLETLGSTGKQCFSFNFLESGLD